MIFDRLKKEHSTGRAISHKDAAHYSLPHRLIFWIESHFLSAAICAVLILLIGIVFFVMQSSDKAAYFYFNSCLGEWSNTNNAEGPPTVIEDESAESFNLNNSAVLSRNIGGIFCADLYGTVPQGSTPKKAELNLSLALIDEPDLIVEVDQSSLNEEGEISADAKKPEEFFDIGEDVKDFEDGLGNQESISHDKVSINESIFSGTIVDEEEPFLEIYFSYDDGENWLLADTVGRSNWKDLSYNVPFFDWNSIQNFQVSIHGIKRLPNQPDVYLDSLWLSVIYEENKAVVSNTNFAEPKDAGLTYSSEEFENTEDPSFKVFEDFTSISCEIKPFTIFAEKGETANYKVTLVKTGRDMPYRLSVGKTPDLVLPRLIISNDEGNENIEIMVDISPGAEAGSYSMVLLYEGLVSKSIFAKDDKYETTYCRFNLTVI